MFLSASQPLSLPRLGWQPAPCRIVTPRLWIDFVCRLPCVCRAVWKNLPLSACYCSKCGHSQRWSWGEVQLLFPQGKTKGSSLPDRHFEPGSLLSSRPRASSYCRLGKQTKLKTRRAVCVCVSDGVELVLCVCIVPEIFGQRVVTAASLVFCVWPRSTVACMEIFLQVSHLP